MRTTKFKPLRCARNGNPEWQLSLRMPMQTIISLLHHLWRTWRVWSTTNLSAKVCRNPQFTCCSLTIFYTVKSLINWWRQHCLTWTFREYAAHLVSEHLLPKTHKFDSKMRVLVMSVGVFSLATTGAGGLEGRLPPGQILVALNKHT